MTSDRPAFPIQTRSRSYHLFGYPRAFVLPQVDDFAADAVLRTWIPKKFHLMCLDCLPLLLAWIESPALGSLHPFGGSPNPMGRLEAGYYFVPSFLFHFCLTESNGTFA
jgi:hypothetical protein